ncbi:hypothetical protein ACFL4T_12255 [candidate division KSB1 bacterium]
MKRYLLFIILIICETAFTQEKLSDLKGPYLGQKPPVKKAVLFAPNVIKYEVHGSPSISQDRKEIIIDSMDEGVKYYKMIDGIWSLQKELPFNIPGACNGIFISPSGRKIYLLVWINGNEHFYFCEKRNEQWTTPCLLGEEVKTSASTWQFTSAKNENLYFSFNGKIVVSIFKNNTHLKPVPLILENKNEFEGGTPFIAPDESYLIFNIRKEKASDLYISYKLKNNTWTKPIDLGLSINKKGKMDMCPIISPCGKYLFFISRRNGPDFQVFWADAGFVEELKPAELK